jgi:hypothetical protein
VLGLVLGLEVAEHLKLHHWHDASTGFSNAWQAAAHKTCAVSWQPFPIDHPVSNLFMSRAAMSLSAAALLSFSVGRTSRSVRGGNSACPPSEG